MSENTSPSRSSLSGKQILKRSTSGNVEGMFYPLFPSIISVNLIEGGKSPYSDVGLANSLFSGYSTLHFFAVSTCIPSLHSLHAPSFSSNRAKSYVLRPEKGTFLLDHLSLSFSAPMTS
jgi:hypothetical protein